MTKTETIKVLNEALTDKDMKEHLLGHFVGWSLTGVSTTKTEAIRVAAECGIAEFLKVPNITPPCAYLRAVRDQTTGVSDTKQFEPILLENNEFKQVHAIVERSVVEAALASGQITREETDAADFVAGKEAHFDEVVRVAFDKKKYNAGGVTAECFVAGNDSDVANEIFESYKQACDTIRPNDVRIAFQRAFEAWDGVRVIDHGGMWWIPSHRTSEVEGWERFLKALGGQPVIIPIFSTDKAKETMKRMVENSAVQQVKSLKAKVEKFDEKTRESTIEKRMDDLKNLRTKLEVWRRYFEVETNDIAEAIQDLEKQGVDIIMARSSQSEPAA